MSPTISVVVPVYNEAELIPTALPALVEALESTGVSYLVHLVENGSTDGTAQVAASLPGLQHVEVSSLPEPDYGLAMRHGFSGSTGDWVINFDIDYFSADFVRSVLEQPETVDVVIGSKRDPESEDRRSFTRRLATRVFNLILKLVLGSGVSDTHGMKGFKRRLVDDLVPHVISNKDLFDTELVVRAERAGYGIVEVPVTVVEVRAAKSSLLKRAPRTIAGLFKLRRALASERKEAR